MSFFQQQGDDSNLQYDDAAFLYFIASALSISAIALTTSIIRSLLSLGSQEEDVLKKEPVFTAKVARATSEKRGKIITAGLFIKIMTLLAVCVLFMMVFTEGNKAEHKLKGFDPYDILGLDQNATLREIKKAYRKLALEYHPDKNQGNAQAQNKFILISKSYECFTNEQKKANCFKFGNPDGEGSFRVGIGLPHFFINVDHQYIVLPIVLIFLLVIVPWMMINWNNRIKTLDHNGISVGSYATLFKALPPKIDKFTFLYILISYPEVYEDEDPIREYEKEKLFETVRTQPLIDRPILYQLDDRQLAVFWEIYKYSTNASDYTVSGLRQKVQDYLSKTLSVVKMFLSKELNGEMLYDNPEWTIKYLGPPLVEAYSEFQRDYYGRTLLVPPSNENWLQYLQLDEGQRQNLKQVIKAKGVANKLYQTLKSPQGLKAFLGYVPESKRERIERQMRSWPLYNLQLKLKLKGIQTNNISNTDYSYIYFKVNQVNETKGFSYIQNYPYPKKDKIYLMGVDGNEVVFFREVEMYGKKEYVQKVPYRTGVMGQHVLRVFVLHEACRGIDLAAVLQFTVKETPQEEVQKPVEFHPEDINLERLYKNFFEELIDLSMDPDENALSDSQGEDNDDKKEQEEGGKGGKEGEGGEQDSSESEVDLVEQAND